MTDWYKMGSAPKDKEILVYGGKHFWEGLSCPNEGCPANFVGAAYWKYDMWVTGEESWREPTRWTPMPEPPLHDSDCALHNEPAMPNGPCDCSLSQ